MPIRIQYYWETSFSWNSLSRAKNISRQKLDVQPFSLVGAQKNVVKHRFFHCEFKIIKNLLKDLLGELFIFKELVRDQIEAVDHPLFFILKLSFPNLPWGFRAALLYQSLCSDCICLKTSRPCSLSTQAKFQGQCERNLIFRCIPGRRSPPFLGAFFWNIFRRIRWPWDLKLKIFSYDSSGSSKYSGNKLSVRGSLFTSSGLKVVLIPVLNIISRNLLQFSLKRVQFVNQSQLNWDFVLWSLGVCDCVLKIN